MELVSIQSPSEIVAGDVIVAKYADKAYTALINDISTEEDEDYTSWVFRCQPVTEVTTVEGKQTLIHHDKMDFMFDNTSVVPDEVFAVR